MSKAIRVLYPNDSTLAFVANPFQIARLMDRECIALEREVNPRYAWLMVPLRVARAVLAPPKIVRTSGGCTTVKQDPGAARWVQRVDMAGRGAGSLPATTLHFKLAHLEVDGNGRREVGA